MKLKPWLPRLPCRCWALMSSAVSFAHSKAHLDAGATKALTHFYALNPANRKLVDRAAGVLIFSRVTKGGVGVAGEFGEGVLRVKGQTVNYYSVGSASVGLTLGVGRHSEIILFMTQSRWINSRTAKVGRSERTPRSRWSRKGPGANTTAPSPASPFSDCVRRKGFDRRFVAGRLEGDQDQSHRLTSRMTDGPPPWGAPA